MYVYKYLQIERKRKIFDIKRNENKQSATKEGEDFKMMLMIMTIIIILIIYDLGSRSKCKETYESWKTSHATSYLPTHTHTHPVVFIAAMFGNNQN